MNDKIKKTYLVIHEKESILFCDLMVMDNHMNECSCEKHLKYNFSNTLPSNEITVFCLHCGGHISLEK